MAIAIVSRDGKLAASISQKGQIILWDLVAGTQIGGMLFNDEATSSVAFSPAGDELSVGMENGVIIRLRVEH